MFGLLVSSDIVIKAYASDPRKLGVRDARCFFGRIQDGKNFGLNFSAASPIKKLE